jgi:hypothetical protein
MADQKAGAQGEAQTANGGRAGKKPADGGPGAATDAVAAFGAALLKAADAKAADTADPHVSAAFALGWHMSQLYEKQTRAKDAPADLPGLGSLTTTQRIAILIDQVEVGVHALSDPITRSGLDVDDLTKLKDLRQTQLSKDPVMTTHVQLLGDLTAADPRLGKAYGLGRALADSCRQPSDLKTLKDELDPHRLANLLRWLDDLETAFPPHAASSVGKSLARWRDALYPSPHASSPPDQGGWKGLVASLKRVFANGSAGDSGATVSAGGGAEATTEQMEFTAPGVDPQKAVRALRRQGELWRALLSGEKQGADMLEIDNYLDAAKELLSRARGLVLRAIAKMPVLSALVVALLAAGVSLLVLGSSSQLVGGVTSILVALGLTWKGLGGTLGQLARNLERPLWGAVLDDAIADAITLLSDNSAEKGGRRQVALTVTAEARREN